MSKGLALVVLTLALVAAVGVALLLMIPYGIAEPGQPHGWGPEALLWSIGECAWTWWVYVRRTPPAPPPARRWQAVAVVVALVVVGATIGLRLQARSAWEASAWVAALATTAGCRLGRWRLRADAAA